MKETIRQKMIIPETGLKILMPPHATFGEEENNILESERQRITSSNGRVLSIASTTTEGKSYMENTCDRQNEQFYRIARQQVPRLLSIRDTVSPQANIAVILYGSVANGLVRNENHPDQSDIDMIVLGKFSAREVREVNKYIEVGKKSYEDEVLTINPDSKLPRISIKAKRIQDYDNGNYKRALQIIGTSAHPLHDPTNIWQELEAKALRISIRKNQLRKKTKYKPHPIDRWFRRAENTQSPEGIREHEIYNQIPLLSTDTSNIDIVDFNQYKKTPELEQVAD